ncbi:MAG TPA: helix-hairpin-helix domain-containing protein [Gammaproteobacteria bacterium]|nr:helix-hairpin-helix domain-containing protein [Gammaproteobacteria bacterium]
MKKLFTCLWLWLALLPLTVFSAQPIDINSADSQMLVDELVGIGPQKAMAIVRYRQQHGPFQRVEDLALVNGIGARTVEQNRGRMTVAGPGTQTPANTAKKP